MTAGPALWRNARLATMAGDAPWGWIEDGAMLVERGLLRWVGPLHELPAPLRAGIAREHDLGGAEVGEVEGRGPIGGRQLC